MISLARPRISELRQLRASRCVASPSHETRQAWVWFDELASSGIDAPVFKVLAGGSPVLSPVDLARPWGIPERAKEPKPRPVLLG
jgi:hypothetical protein